MPFSAARVEVSRIMSTTAPAPSFCRVLGRWSEPESSRQLDHGSPSSTQGTAFRRLGASRMFPKTPDGSAGRERTSDNTLSTG